MILTTTTQDESLCLCACVRVLACARVWSCYKQGSWCSETLSDWLKASCVPEVSCRPSSLGLSGSHFPPWITLSPARPCFHPHTRSQTNEQQSEVPQTSKMISRGVWVNNTGISARGLSPCPAQGRILSPPAPTTNHLKRLSSYIPHAEHQGQNKMLKPGEWGRSGARESVKDTGPPPSSGCRVPWTNDLNYREWECVLSSWTESVQLWNNPVSKVCCPYASTAEPVHEQQTPDQFHVETHTHTHTAPWEVDIHSLCEDPEEKGCHSIETEDDPGWG